MGFGGSSSPQPQEQTVYSQKLPPYAEPYYTRLLKRGEAESLQPYTPYGGQRLAYFSPDELAGQAMTRGFAQSGTPQEFIQAREQITGLSSPYQTGYQPSQFDAGYSAGQVGPTYQAERLGTPSYQASNIQTGYQPLGFEQNVERFMSPYQQAVTDIQKREARRASDIAGEQIGLQAAQSGGLGGYREAILQAERERNLSQQLGDIQARGSQQAYEQATRQLAAERQAGLEASRLGLSAQQLEDQARQAEERFRQTGFQTQQQALQAESQQNLAAYQASESARQKAAQLGLSAQQQEDAARQAAEKFGQTGYELGQKYGLMGATQLQGLGQARQQDALSRIQALSGIGSQARALRQAGLDMGYEDFMRQRAYPQQQLGFFSNLLQGLPIQPQQTISTFQQQPGLFQQALGLGLGGLGLYKGLQR
jgi:hypothetical protein